MKANENTIVYEKMYSKDTHLWFVEFMTALNSIFDEKAHIRKEDLYFATMSNAYFCDYRPRYPEKTAGDITIFYDWVSNDARIYGNLYATIPTIIKYDSFAEMCDALKYIDF